MTEQEWMEYSDPIPMLRFLRDHAGERKLRLFVCACTRLLWDLLPDGQMQEAIEVGEKFADGLVTWEEAQHCVHYLHKTVVVDYKKEGDKNWFVDHSDDEVAAWSGAICCVGHLYALAKVPDKPGYQRLLSATRQQQPRLLRDIFEHPFFPFAFNPNWRTRESYESAQAAYSERLLPSGELDPQQLADLANALEQSGATSVLLDHLRGPDPHVRGCWVVDAVLGKK